MDIRPIDASALQEELQWLKQQAGSTNEDTYNDMMYRVCNRPTLSLNTLRDAIYQDAVAHGLWEKHDERFKSPETYAMFGMDINVMRRRDCGYLVKEETYELIEAAGYEEAFSEELADVIIMSMSVAGKLGIDIDAAIRRKMEINKARPWKHQGEKK